MKKNMFQTTNQILTLIIPFAMSTKHFQTVGSAPPINPRTPSKRFQLCLRNYGPWRFGGGFGKSSTIVPYNWTYTYYKIL
jgi:hypothetical protein